MAIAERCFRKPFAFVGLYAPIILAVMLKLRVTVAIGTVFLDAVEEWASGVVHAVVAAEREPITFAFVSVRSTGENESVLDLASHTNLGNHLSLIHISEPTRR